MINRNNYESFLLDYMEGNLEGALREELALFLEENPDIKEELELLGDFTLPVGNDVFPEKNNLKKQVTAVGKVAEGNYERFFIAYYEGTLSLEEKKAVEEFVEQNAFLKKDFDLFSKLYLTPDLSVQYSGKEQLKHKRKPVVLLWYVSGVAAAVLIILFGLFNLIKPENGSSPDIATVEKTIDTTIPKYEHNKTVEKILAEPNGAVVADNHDNRKIAVKAKVSAKEKPAEPKVVKKHEISRVDIFILSSKSPQIALVDKTPYERIRVKHLRKLREKQPLKPQKKSVAGALLAGLMNKAKKELPSVPKSNTDNNEPALAKIMDGGITVLATITGSEPDVEKLYNGKGELIAYRISAEQFNFTKSFNKSKE